MSLRKTLLVLACATAIPLGQAAAQTPHNLILFVPDGLRSLSVTPQSAPTMAAVRDKGVNFANPHSLFPTFTMANASGMATGHFLGDTGVFSNTIYVGFATPHAAGSVTPFIESDTVLGDIDDHFSGNFVDEDAVLFAARHQGFSTAAIGKVGPARMFDHVDRTGENTIIVDDATGSAAGVPLSQDMKDALAKASLPLTAPGRAANGNAGDAKKPGTTVANVGQQKYFADVATKVVLPMLKARNKPFVLVFWSRDPDGTQHNQGDSPLKVTPGINGPTSLAAIKNADDNLADLRQALDELGLAATTDIIVSADHGFSTISKQSKTSAAAQAQIRRRAGRPAAAGLRRPRSRQGARTAARRSRRQERAGRRRRLSEARQRPDRRRRRQAGRGRRLQRRLRSGLRAGQEPRAHRRGGRRPARSRTMSAACSSTTISARFAGTLPLSAINLKGALGHAAAVGRRSTSAPMRTGCDKPVLCAVNVADTGLQQGQGMHGSFNRADTMNFMAAIGPDFKAGFVDEAPVSNADVGKTMAHILGLEDPVQGRSDGPRRRRSPAGRREPGGGELHRAVASRATRALPPSWSASASARTRYFDAAGFPGRTVGMDERKAASR